MFARVVTFTGVRDIDAAVAYIRDTALPIIRSQRGYKGLNASADRSGGVLGTLSLWATEADRDASESALAKAREDAAQMMGAQMTVETFDERVVEVSRPPKVGSVLMLTRVAMDPAKIDENTEFFGREVAPQIKAQAGFQALRNMMNPQTGEGMVGTTWDDADAMQAAAAEAQARRGEAAERGVTFTEISTREIVLTDSP